MIKTNTDGVKTTQNFKLKITARSTEADIRALISNFLNEECGIPITEQKLERRSKGQMDIFLPNRRTIIEVKRPVVFSLRKTPHSPNTGSPQGGKTRTAFEQLEDYILAQRRDRKITEWVDDESDYNWLGIITTGERWWAYEWMPADKGDIHKSLDEWQDISLHDDNKDNFSRMLNRDVTKPFIPNDPTHIFKEGYDKLTKLYDERKDMMSTTIQRNLWSEQLKAGGNKPPKDNDDMFVRHTLLILVSRIVSATISNVKNEDTGGFVDWVPDDSSERKYIRKIIREWEWRGGTIDVLRNLYEGFIKKEQRHAFGEYYTPDWLAEMICDKVITDDYILEQIRSFRCNGSTKPIMDPSCGSGTFLYHAIRRIRKTDAFKNSYLEDDSTKFLTSMIRGIDIHPVAVEMARANIRRLLPDANPTQIEIRQGDSLLTPRSDSIIEAYGNDILRVKSPHGDEIMLPSDFILDARCDIGSFVKSANEDNEMPDSLGAFLDSEESYKKLTAAHNSLRDIIRKEGNGVWAWYIRNQIAPIRLSVEKVGCIVTNPPWINTNEIPDQTRQNEIIQMADILGMWKGGKMAANFNLASLCVTRWLGIYLETDSKTAGFALPLAAKIGGGGWKKMREMVNACYLDFGTLPFNQPHSSTCVMLVNTKQKQNYTYRKKRGMGIDRDDTWDDVKQKITHSRSPVFPIRKSEYVVGKNAKATARKGADLIPAPLVRISRLEEVEDEHNVRIFTETSFKRVWKDLGSQTGIVPRAWVTECIRTANMMGYYAPTRTSYVLPLDGSEWDAERHGNKFWQNVSFSWEKIKSGNSRAPQTLEGNLDYNKKLFKQFERSSEYGIIYNNGGEKIHASIAQPRVLIDSGVYFVPCVSENEAKFLTVILNSDCMLKSLCSTKESVNNFGTFLWSKLPIPRFNPDNENHLKLVKLYTRAYHIVRNAYKEDMTIEKARQHTRKALRNDGVATEIDKTVHIILPEYALD